MFLTDKLHKAIIFAGSKHTNQKRIPDKGHKAVTEITTKASSRVTILLQYKK